MRDEEKTRAELLEELAGARGRIEELLSAETRRHKTAEALRQSEATLRSLVLASPIGIGLARERILEWTNDRISRLTGYSPEELIGQDARILYPDDEEYERVGRIKHAQVRAEGVGYIETRWRRKDGEVLDIWLSSSAIDPDDFSAGLVFTAMDLTERNRAEEALRQSEASYRSLVRNAVYGIYRSTLDGRLLDVNPALVEMLGYESRAELLAKNLGTDVYRRPADRERLVEFFEKKSVVDAVEVDWRRRDGTPITVRLSGRPVRDADGDLRHWEMIAEDVTERRILEDQLRQAQKLEGIGQLAGGIAHDFNNLLTAIGGYATLVTESLSEDDANHSRLLEINRAAERATSLTRQLLAFSRKQLLSPRVLCLNDVVEGMEGMLRRLIGENIELRTCLAKDLGHVRADHGQIEQVLLNLAVNARDAMPDGGVLTLETTNATTGLEGACRDPAVPPGPRVRLRVTDTGCGMDDEVRRRVFEPFFTTKDRERGTGLGLSTVYGIVKQSEGHIRCESEPGRGSTFTVCLPRVEGPLDVAPEEEPAAERTNGRGSILLVEDDEGVRTLASEVLDESGYSVLTASSGPEAVRILGEYRGEIDLLLTDVVLPGMSGPEVAERIRADRPDLRVVFMSGYTGEAIGDQLTSDRGAPLLEKPFTPSALEQVVRDALR